MRFKAALLLLSLLMAAPAQAQQINDRIGRLADDRFYGIPLIDAKLELLIEDVDRANFFAVEYHNDKLVPEVKKNMPVDVTWLKQQAGMAARWKSWDHAFPEWFLKKKVEASASLSVSGGVGRVRSMETVEVQNKTLLLWRSVLIGIDQLDESKGLIKDVGKMKKLWSDWLGKVDRLSKAINALRKY